MGLENHTTRRAIRVPDEEWCVAMANAAAEGKTLTEVIRAFLRRYNARRTPRVNPVEEA